MLKHQNPEELADDEVKEGEILPPEEKRSHMAKGPTADELFKFETDLDYLASEGHGIWGKLGNFNAFSRMVGVIGFLGIAASFGAIWYVNVPSEWISRHIPDWLTLSSANVASVNPNPDAPDIHSRSWLGRLAWSVIGFDETKAVTLPDGQQVHAKYAFLSQLPPARAGQLNAEGFQKLVDDYKALVTWTPSVDDEKLAEAKRTADEMEKVSGWNTEAWNFRYLMATSGRATTKPSDIPTVPAQGFWKSESSQQEMASNGVIVTDGNKDFYAAAYIGGVPAVTYFPDPSTCYTVFGISHEGCRPLSDLGEYDLKHIRDTLYGATPEQIAAAPTKAAEKVTGEEDRWYLDFPLTADSSTLSQANFDILIKAIDDSAKGQGGFSFHTSITSPISLLPAQAMTAPAKGLLKNSSALEAMKKGGVIGTTDIPGRVVLAAYVDGKAQIRIRTEDQRCAVLLGDNGNHCWTADLANDADLQALAKSLFENPEAADQALKPYFWYSAAPTVAEKSVDLEEILAAFRPVMDDAVNYGVDIRTWTFTRKLPAEAQPVFARPEGFFLNPKNIAALSKSEFVDKNGKVSRNTGAVIIPEGMKNTLFLAVNYQGHLSLNAIELLSRGEWNCTTVFGQPRQPIGQCKPDDLTEYADIVKSMFEPKPE